MRGSPSVLVMTILVSSLLRLRVADRDAIRTSGRSWIDASCWTLPSSFALLPSSRVISDWRVLRSAVVSLDLFSVCCSLAIAFCWISISDCRTFS